MSRRSRRTWLTVIMVLAVVVASCSDAVQLPDCVDCRPVEMSRDQQLEVELGSDRAVSDDPEAYRWVVTKLGSMALASEDRGTRSEDPGEFVGGYSTYVIYIFDPTSVGTTQMRFELLPTGDQGPAATTLDIDVIVND